ncbi:MAG: DNA (cytosine-5-)-methyltransferase [Dehalococcoidia bacterium]|nr:DNA (cytosine-5-)-methyltransferase [Dehalococcoidia bacterium]
MPEPYRVIDLFAGPGGLAEGFSSLRRPDGRPVFQLGLSIEKEPVAHRTLRLRGLFRLLREHERAEPYYAYVKGELDWDSLRTECGDDFAAADREAWNAELGVTSHAEVRSRVVEALEGERHRWLLMGGPPCQAYSLVGRSRMRGRDPEAFAADHRHFLYREYLRILAEHAPCAFVMENVKGLLSSRVNNEGTFQRILDDLENPAASLGLEVQDASSYRLFALSRGREPSVFHLPGEFVVRAEHHGVPQRRHRVIIIGIRRDLLTDGFALTPLSLQAEVPIEDVIDDLPRLRSGLSSEDDPGRWRAWVGGALERLQATDDDNDMAAVVRETAIRFSADLARGTEYSRVHVGPSYRPDWYTDPQFSGILNHATRGHMAEDLERYLFAACFAQAKGRSPSLQHFPDRLLPDHENVDRAIDRGLFNDRFRVQLYGQPATTITSHISKDGHYYIHPDPTQCRSLTVREAARLQTFPDNYFFEGPRTSQYVQVGNAVPPLLAAEVAAVVRDALDALV